MTQKTLERILVIEDNEKHLADARAYFADKPVEVVYASTLDRARELYDSVDAVISDVFFPEHEGGTADKPMGVRVAAELDLKKPVVLCSAGNYHGKKLSPVRAVAHAYMWELVSEGATKNTEGEWDSEAPTKDWRMAYQGTRHSLDEQVPLSQFEFGGLMSRFELYNNPEQFEDFKSGMLQRWRKERVRYLELERDKIGSIHEAFPYLFRGCRMKLNPNEE